MNYCIPVPAEKQALALMRSAPSDTELLDELERFDLPWINNTESESEQ